MEPEGESGQVVTAHSEPVRVAVAAAAAAAAVGAAVKATATVPGELGRTGSGFGAGADAELAVVVEASHGSCAWQEVPSGHLRGNFSCAREAVGSLASIPMARWHCLLRANAG